MTVIDLPPDCGNAPRKMQLRDYYTSLVNDDLKTLKAMIDDQTVWCTAGKNSIHGEDALLTAIKNHPARRCDKLEIETIITHGPQASVNGIIVRGFLKFAFCEVFQYRSAASNKLRSITSYLIPVNEA